MSDTPRTGALLESILRRDRFLSDKNAPEEWVVHARQLERELAAAQDRVRFLEKGIAEQNQEIEQTCGTILGYPWFKDDQKNFPGSTEKDGVCVGEHVAETIVMELAKKYTAAQARMQRLVEAGDRAADLLACSMGVGESEEWANSFCQQHIEMTHDALGGWTAAKE